MHVSYGELIRITPESIRMLGFTFAQADDSVEGIIWTQCVLGRGYHLLRMADQRRPRGKWSGSSVVGSGDATVVSLQDQPAFAFAARLADLAQCEAATPRSDRAGLVVASGAFGGWIAPFIAFRLARAGYHADVVWLPGQTPSADEAPATLVSVTAAGPGGADRLLISPGSAYRATDFVGGAGARGVLSARISSKLGELTAGMAGSSVLAIVASRSSMPASVESLMAPFAAGGYEVPSASAFGVLDAGGRLRQAIESGLEVEQDDHRVLTRLSQRIRLPNSDRSRAQAG